MPFPRMDQNVPIALYEFSFVQRPHLFLDDIEPAVLLFFACKDLGMRVSYGRWCNTDGRTFVQVGCPPTGDQMAPGLLCFESGW